MKTTEINIVAFNSEITITIIRPEYISVKGCINYVRHTMEWPTAEIISIKQGCLTVENKNQHKIPQFDCAHAQQYLRRLA